MCLLKTLSPENRDAETEETTMGKTGRIGFGAVTIFLILVTAFCCAGTVLGRAGLNQREMENYYREQERQLVSEARAYLNAGGFVNSGIMLTHITETDGSRMYTMTVHHGKIDKMSEEERQRLLAELESFAFESPNCSFYHEFLDH